MEPGLTPIAIPQRRRPHDGWRGSFLAGAFPALAGLAALALGGAGLRWGWFDTGAGGLLLLALEGALINVTLLAAFLALRERLLRRRALIALYRRELGYLRSWASEEGLLRKVGLIRELNALGAAPLDLDQAILRETDLSGCDLRGTSLRGADLRQANLQGSLLDGADLFGADLTGANLALASLAGAAARGANLDRAVLTKARLQGAILSRASLVDANLHGVDLRETALDRARFARRDGGAIGESVHPSVDDWIRARLDAKGCYAGEAPVTPAPRTPGKAKAG
jgi:uncharacterized protein YjbI with pentapeptide repeats